MGPTLGQRLRALRIERGLSQADLAGDLVSPSYVSLIESDRRSPEREVLDRLARRLGCSALYLESGVAPEEINEQRLKLQFAKIARANSELTEARNQFGTLALAATADIRHEALWGLASTCEALGELNEAMTHLEALLNASRAGGARHPGTTVAHERPVPDLLPAPATSPRSIEVGEAALQQVGISAWTGRRTPSSWRPPWSAATWLAGTCSPRSTSPARSSSKPSASAPVRPRATPTRNAAGVAASSGQLTLALDLATKTLALLAGAPRRTIWRACGSPTPGSCCDSTRRSSRRPASCWSRRSGVSRAKRRPKRGAEQLQKSSCAPVRPAARQLQRGPGSWLSSAIRVARPMRPSAATPAWSAVWLRSRAVSRTTLARTRSLTLRTSSAPSAPSWRPRRPGGCC